MPDQSKRKTTDELALELERDVKQDREGGKTEVDQNAETIERFRVPEHMSVRELVTIDGGLTIHCAVCNHSWKINIYEQQWVFNDELKCRRCMARSGEKSVRNRPLTPIFIEASVGQPKKEEDLDNQRY